LRRSPNQWIPTRRTSRLCLPLLCLLALPLIAQQPATSALPDAPGTTQAEAAAARISGSITDTSGAAIPGARVTLEDAAAKPLKILSATTTDTTGSFVFTPVAPGTYLLRIAAKGFSSWKIESVPVSTGQHVELTPVELGVESIDSVVDAITVEDLAEQQITAEEHQRILGILPNFFVSYVPHAAPLTKRQKFKLALVVSRDPLTFMTTGITAGIEQAEGDFAGYGPGFTGYASRYAATYGDRLSATFLGAAIFPSLFHQDPRYFYRGHGRIITRALYAISTVVICKGDNGHWQPNYSNVFGNLASGGISSFYYPNSAKHDVQTSVDNTLIGVAEGSIGTLFQEFLLRHVTHGVPGKNP
jgi:hypothetical protein